MLSHVSKYGTLNLNNGFFKQSIEIVREKLMKWYKRTIDFTKR